MNLFILAFFIFMFLFVLGVDLFFILKGPVVVGTNNIFFPSNKKHLPSKVSYEKELVCQDDYYHLHWLAVTYHINSDFTNILGALLLEWLFSGQISVNTNANGKPISLNFTRPFLGEDEIERSLYNYFLSSTVDGMVDLEKIRSWTTGNYMLMVKWFQDVLDRESSKLLKTFQLQRKDAYASNNLIIATDDLYEEAIRVKGVKKFFKASSKNDFQAEYTMGLWKYYLIYAQILGLATPIFRLLKRYYPEYVQGKEYSYDNIRFALDFSNKFAFFVFEVKKNEEKRVRGE